MIGITAERCIGAIVEKEVAHFLSAITGAEALDRHAWSGLYLSSVMDWNAEPVAESMREDGTTESQVLSGASLSGLRLMGGGQELEFHQDVPLGEEIVVSTQLADAQLREASSGALLLLTVQSVFETSAGPILTRRETFIGR